MIKSILPWLFRIAFAKVAIQVITPTPLVSYLDTKILDFICMVLQITSPANARFPINVSKDPSQ